MAKNAIVFAIKFPKWSSLKVFAKHLMATVVSAKSAKVVVNFLRRA